MAMWWSESDCKVCPFSKPAIQDASSAWVRLPYSSHTTPRYGRSMEAAVEASIIPALWPHIP